MPSSGANVTGECSETAWTRATRGRASDSFSCRWRPARSVRVTYNEVLSLADAMRVMAAQVAGYVVGNEAQRPIPFLQTLSTMVQCTYIDPASLEMKMSRPAQPCQDTDCCQRGGTPREGDTGIGGPRREVCQITVALVHARLADAAFCFWAEAPGPQGPCSVAAPRRSEPSTRTARSDIRRHGRCTRSW